MKARQLAQPQAPKWRNPIDDPATFERIDKLLGALSRDPDRFGRYELSAPKDERDLICLYAAKARPANACGGARHVIACILSLSWQFPEHYGPIAQPGVRRRNRLGVILREAPPEARNE